MAENYLERLPGAVQRFASEQLAASPSPYVADSTERLNQLLRVQPTPSPAEEEVYRVAWTELFDSAARRSLTVDDVGRVLSQLDSGREQPNQTMLAGLMEHATAQLKQISGGIDQTQDERERLEVAETAREVQARVAHFVLTSHISSFFA